MRQLMIGVAAVLLIGSVDARAAETPAAVMSDPPQDKAHPAGETPFALPTHGVKINAVLFTAPGSGPHPTVILFHGVPGNETNTNLARAIQRAGWNVVTLHYRGSWAAPATAASRTAAKTARRRSPGSANRRWPGATASIQTGSPSWCRNRTFRSSEMGGGRV